MNLKDIGAGTWQVLKSVAPTIATAAAGPFAPLVAPLLNKVFGIDPSDPKAVETAILGMTPEQAQTLRTEEHAFEIRIKELGIQKEQLELQDVANARAMQMSTHDPNVARLAWLVIGGFLLISLAQLACMVFAPDAVAKLPQAGWLLVGSISGYLASEAKQAAAFYFGTTAGSQAKDATIADIAKAP